MSKQCRSDDISESRLLMESGMFFRIDGGWFTFVLCQFISHCRYSEIRTRLYTLKRLIDTDFTISAMANELTQNNSEQHI